MLGGKDPMMEVRIRVSLKSKTNQSLRSDPPTKFLLIYQGLTKNRVRNPKIQGVNGGGSQNEKSNCAKRGKKHICKCLVGRDNCFG